MIKELYKEYLDLNLKIKTYNYINKEEIDKDIDKLHKISSEIYVLMIGKYLPLENGKILVTKEDYFITLEELEPIEEESMNFKETAKEYINNEKVEIKLTSEEADFLLIIVDIYLDKFPNMPLAMKIKKKLEIT